MSSRSAEVVGGLAFVALAAACWIISFRFPPAVAGGAPPALFPRIAATIVGILCLWMAGYAALSERAPRPPEDAGSAATKGLFALGIVIYAVLIPMLGFLLATLLYLVATIGLLRREKPVQVLLVSAVVALAVWWSFGVVLGVDLPRGPW